MGRYRSGQPGQTVNLLALRLRRFESCSAHIKKQLISIGCFFYVDMKGFEVYARMGKSCSAHIKRTRFFIWCFLLFIDKIRV